MSPEAFVQLVRSDGLVNTPYFIAVYVRLAGAPIMYLPAVVDDFGDVVIVGGPL